MSATLNSAVTGATVSGSEQLVDGNAAGPESINHSAGQSYANGTANGQAQHFAGATITVNNTGTTLDLTAIAGMQAATRNFASIQELLIENVDQTNAVNVGPGAANGWTGINGTNTGSIPLEAATATTAGGHLKRSSPNTGLVVGGTNKTILIAAAAGTAQVKYTFLGRGT